MWMMVSLRGEAWHLRVRFNDGNRTHVCLELVVIVFGFELTSKKWKVGFSEKETSELSQLYSSKKFGKIGRI